MELFTAADQVPVVAQSLMQVIVNTEDHVRNECLEADKEIQFNEWLQKLDNILCCQGFIIRANKQNKDIIPNICITTRRCCVPHKFCTEW